MWVDCQTLLQLLRTTRHRADLQLTPNVSATGLSDITTTARAFPKSEAIGQTRQALQNQNGAITAAGQFVGGQIHNDHDSDNCTLCRMDWTANKFAKKPQAGAWSGVWLARSRKPAQAIITPPFAHASTAQDGSTTTAAATMKAAA